MHPIAEVIFYYTVNLVNRKVLSSNNLFLTCYLEDYFFCTFLFVFVFISFVFLLFCFFVVVRFSAFTLSTRRPLSVQFVNTTSPQRSVCQHDVPSAFSLSTRRPLSVQFSIVHRCHDVEVFVAVISVFKKTSLCSYII